MRTDRYTKLALTLIAIGLLLNAANNLSVPPADAFENSYGGVVRSSHDITHYGNITITLKGDSDPTSSGFDLNVGLEDHKNKLILDVARCVGCGSTCY